MAAWTAEAVAALGPDHAVPAGCRGSGSPALLRWLGEQLNLGPGTTVLDVGAGVGGPAAFAAQTFGARPILIEPEPAACRAARRMFRLPVTQATGTRLPFPTDSCSAAWCLGVLCSTTAKAGMLAELARVLRPGGRLGVLVYVANPFLAVPGPAGNQFPTADELDDLLNTTGFTIDTHHADEAFDPPSNEWRRRATEVEQAIARRHRADASWQLAVDRSEQLAVLQRAAMITGCVIVATRAGGPPHQPDAGTGPATTP